MLLEFLVAALLVMVFLVIYIVPDKLDKWLTRKLMKHTKRNIKRRLSIKRIIKNGRL